MADVRDEATRMAEDIAQSAPLAVMSIRETLRRGLADAVEVATERELAEQEWQFKTADFREGAAAMAARRPPNFQGA
jgi:enoyl-CoA hydratase/carnithine racemase